MGKEWWLKDRRFLTAKDEEIIKGMTTDIYFIRTVKILKETNKYNVDVTMEITSGKLPYGWKWGIIAGTLETINLFQNKNLDLYLMKEGTLFKPFDENGIRIPIGYLRGEYGEFAIYETPLLGLLCQASGIATYSAHLRYKAGDKILLSFGARRMHPSITPLIDYAAYIGGFDGISAVLSAELMNKTPQGTMPHALIIIFEDQVEAWKAFDKHIEKDVKRIALIDTFYDEKIEAIMAAEALGEKLFGVRIDTPKSRRGDIKEIIREIRWELDIRGYNHVKIFVSGGVNHENIEEMIEAGADGFGIGTSVSNAPTIDLALDIVEKEGKPIAKRGKMAGMKQVFRCPKCYKYITTTYEMKKMICQECKINMEPLIIKVLEKGKILINLPDPDETKSYVLRQLNILKKLDWGD
jgi:nicotinate phosphoribosyltransferase